MSSTKPLKLLFIGFSKLSQYDCIEWKELNQTNLSNYTSIFINLLTFDNLMSKVNGSTDFKSYNTLKIELGNFAKSIENFIASNGKIFLVTDIEKQYNFYNPSLQTDSLILDNYCWLPVSLSLTEENINEFTITNDKFKEYLGLISEYDFSFSNITIKSNSFHQNENKKIIGKTFTVAISKREKLLSFNYMFSFIDKDDNMYPLGSIYFIPPTSKYSINNDILMIVNKMFNTNIEASITPDWIDSIYFPEINQVNDEIQEVEQVISEHILKKENLILKRDQFYKIRSILFEEKNKLYESVFALFQYLFGNEKLLSFSESGYFIINNDDRKAILLPSGTVQGVKKENIRDLHELVTTWEIEKDEDIKGILVGNSWRLIDPDMRDTLDYYSFTDEVIDFASKRQIGLISTKDLFDLYVLFRDSQISITRLQYLLELLTDPNKIAYLRLVRELYWE